MFEQNKHYRRLRELKMANKWPGFFRLVESTIKKPHAFFQDMRPKSQQLFNLSVDS